MQRAGRPDLPAGRATSSREKRVVTEQSRAYRWSGELSWSSWWLVAKNDGGPVGALTLDEGDTLPVSSGEGELFLWLRGEDQRGWGVHQSSAEELVLVLSGPLSRAGSWSWILLPRSSTVGMRSSPAWAAKSFWSGSSPKTTNLHGMRRENRPEESRLEC